MSNNPLLSLVSKQTAPLVSEGFGVVLGTDPFRISFGLSKDDPGIRCVSAIECHENDKVRWRLQGNSVYIVENYSSFKGMIKHEGRYYAKEGYVKGGTYQLSSIGGGLYGANIKINHPFTPPEGYFFIYTIGGANGYAFLTPSSESSAYNQVYIAGVTNSIRISRFNWSLAWRN